MIELNTSIVIQARLSSNRLPKKIFKEIYQKKIIEYMLDQLIFLKENIPIIIATTNNKNDNPLVEFLKLNSINYFRGSEQNVLSRYCEVIRKFNITNIIRLTSDCPLIDPKNISELLKIFLNESLDYISTDETYPDGMDVEIIKSKCFLEIENLKLLNYQKEHPTQYIVENSYNYKFKKLSLPNNHKDIRITIDEEDDFKFLKEVIRYLHMKNLKPPYQMNDILKIIYEKKLMKINQHIIRNEGLINSKFINY